MSCELFHCLAQKRRFSSFVIGHMFRNWGEFMVSENKMDPLMLLTFVACHTKHCMDKYGIMCGPLPVSQRFHISTEMKPVFMTQQNVCGVCFSCVHSVKVPVHKIQFCFIACIVEYVTLICLM